MDTSCLHKRWTEFTGSLGIGSASPGWLLLDACYSAPNRWYHGWSHIHDCLTKFDELRELAKEPVSIEAAIWFHDALYDSKRNDNEEMSAQLALSCFRGSVVADRAADLIRATSHKVIAVTQDAALLCDIDLSVLGADAERYDRYAEAIRKEYSWVSAEDYRAGRTQVLKSFLSRPSVYSTPPCKQRWEIQARLNLDRELQSLAQLEN